MKNYIIVFLLLLMSFGAGTQVNTVIVKPASPRLVITDWFIGKMSAKDYIQENSKKGYIVKSVTGTEGGYVVVMEKY